MNNYFKIAVLFSVLSGVVGIAAIADEFENTGYEPPPFTSATDEGDIYGGQSEEDSFVSNDRYKWVYLGCFHDSKVNRVCPQTAKGKGYKRSMIGKECARSYWKCYGSM